MNKRTVLLQQMNSLAESKTAQYHDVIYINCIRRVNLYIIAIKSINKEDFMKFSHALILASSLAFFACGGDDDDDSPAGPSKTSYDCTVSNGVKVAYPTISEQFKIGQTIDVVFGTTIEDGYRIVFKKNTSDAGLDLLDESYDLTGPADGKTCHTVKVKLDAEKGVEATLTGIIRVIPYNNQNKGNNSELFVVKE